MHEPRLIQAIVRALDTHFPLFLHGRQRRVRSMVLRGGDPSSPLSRVSALPPPLPGRAGSSEMQTARGGAVDTEHRGHGEEEECEEEEEEEETKSAGTFVDMQEMRQVHQFLVECRLRGVDVAALCTSAEAREAWRKRERMCRAVFEARSRNRAMPSQACTHTHIHMHTNAHARHRTCTRTHRAPQHSLNTDS